MPNIAQKSIHLVITKDAILIQKLYQQGFLDIYERYHDEKTDPYLISINDIQQRLKLNKNYFLLIMVNDDVIGMVYLKKNWRSVDIGSLLILPSFQNQGYGQAALKGIENYFPNIYHWKLNTIFQEPKLLYFYEKMGYKRVKYLKIPIKNGMDIVFYKKKKQKN